MSINVCDAVNIDARQYVPQGPFGVRVSALRPFPAGEGRRWDGRVTTSEGTLPGGLPYLAFGQGPPLVALPGFSGRHANPTGMERSMQTRNLRLPARRFTVHLVQLRPGLPPGTTMSDLADDVAGAVRAHFGGPVPVLGSSTGGSVALQLAVDHPDLVSRLALVCAAARLGDDGRVRQRRLAELTAAGRPRAAWSQLAPAMAATPAGRLLMTALLWLTGPASDPDDPADLLATVAAEDAFDVGAHLGRVTAPTLVVGGARDGFYSRELFVATARGIPDGHLLLFPRGSHMGVASSRAGLRAVTRFLADPEPRPPR